MYCKKCGRQLRSEARFCDHCGQSVREDSQRGSSQRRTTTSRTATATKTATQPKTRADYEKKQRIKREQERKQKQKNARTIFFLILIAIVAATALGFASYNMTKKELNNNSEATQTPQSVQSIDELLSEDEQINDETSQSDEQAEEPTAKPTQKSSETSQEENSEDSPSKNSADFEAVAGEFNIYRDDRMDSIRCPYPKTFEQGSKSNKNTVLSLVDPLNDGAMMISAETVGTSKSASSLMKDYAEGLGGSIQTSRAGDGWYTISFERNNKVNHRKAVIVDGLCVYYDFSYDVDSAEKSSYDEYIEYIDYYIEKELTSLTKKEKTKN